MNSKTTIIAIAILAILSVFIAACTAKISENTSNQLANPASVYCEQQGGELQIITAADGSQSGNCILQNGTVCDEWAYYRGQCGPATVHICTADEKAQIACTLEYLPVCGNNQITYGNACSACGSKEIDSWTNGECAVNSCAGSCPMVTPVSPDFCPGGRVVSGGLDACNCSLPPKCQY